MTKTVSYCALLVVALFLAMATVLRPEIMSDENKFLCDFVGQNLLAILGVILTITLASAAQIHLALNEAETAAGKVFLGKTRSGVHSSSYWLIWLFLVAVAVVVVKPYFSSSQSLQSFFNSASLFILFWMVLIMSSLMRLVFAIKPLFPED
jgi:hypothetical protein